MTPDFLIALLGFALAGVITPGPNNVMLMASGANFGYRQTLPHMAGVGLGVPIMVFPVGIGVMQAFEAWPPLREVLVVVSAVYLLWLAWKIAHASAPGEGKATGRPLTFLQAAGFQWLNPKAWSMVLAAITLYAPERSLVGLLWVGGAFATMAVLSTNTWVLAGQRISQWLRHPRRLRVFNIAMAALLVASMLPSLMR